MQCDSFLPMIEKLADGECSAAEKERVEAHLEACGACRDHYEFLKALPGAARQTTLPEPPGAYWEALPRKIMARVEREKTGEKPPVWLPAWFVPSQLRWLAVVAAGLVVVVLSYEVMMVQETKAPVLEQQQPLSSGSVVPQDKDVPRGFEAVSKETTAELAEEERQQAGEALPIEADDSRPLIPAEEKARGEAPPSPEKTPAKADEQFLRRDLPSEAPKSSIEKPVEEKLVAALADEEAVVLQEKAGKKPATLPPEPSEVFEGAPTKSQDVSIDESKPGVRPEPSPGRARAKLEANKAAALDKIAAVDRSEVASYRSTLGGARELTEIEMESRCNHLRESLERDLKGQERLDARYELAKCSMMLVKLHSTEERRALAEDDVEAFLEIAPEGDKAEEIKRELAALQKKK